MRIYVCVCVYTYIQNIFMELNLKMRFGVLLHLQNVNVYCLPRGSKV